MENDTKNDKEVEADKTEEAKGLSLRDALEVSVTALSEDKEDGGKGSDKSSEGVSRKGVGDTSDSSGNVGAPANGEKVVSKYQPPAEYSPEEKADFLNSSEKQQEAALRLHSSSRNTLSEIRREAADLQWAKDLAKEVEPYLKATGGKKKAHEALIDALKMRREFDEGNPTEAAANYLKAKGVPIPKELLEGKPKDTISDEKIIPLQNEIKEIKIRQAREDQAKAVTILSNVFTEFEGSKNAGGTPRHPDVNDTPTGLRISAQMASLVGVNGPTPLSTQFIANVRERIPNCDVQTLLEEAYKYCGGKVDDSNAPKTPSAQKHIAQSSRAAASRPGGSHSQVSGPVKRYKSTREAAAAALAEIREREGA